MTAVRLVGGGATGSHSPMVRSEKSLPYPEPHEVCKVDRKQPLHAVSPFQKEGDTHYITLIKLMIVAIFFTNANFDYG